MESSRFQTHRTHPHRCLVAYLNHIQTKTNIYRNNVKGKNMKTMEKWPGNVYVSHLCCQEKSNAEHQKYLVGS